MKLGFKNILIIFLVALLGAGFGTYGVISILSNSDQIPDGSQVVINEVAYSGKKESNYTNAIEKAYNTVVEITCTVEQEYQSGFFFFGGGGTQIAQLSGSGVIISADGYIVTNNHVVEGVTEDDAVQVKLYNNEEYTAKIIGKDSRTDLAVIKIEENNLPFASFVDSSELVLGEEVLVIGNPLGTGIACSNGIISALEQEIYINNVYLTVIQTNAAVNQGNSGGGLFDLNGNIAGIVNAKKSAGFAAEASVEGMGYAIPANTVKRIVAEIIDNGYVKDRPALGVRVYTGESYYQINGVLVTEVIEGGSADQAGIKADDIITAIDGIEVKSYADLSKVLDSKLVGDEVTITVTRNEQLLDLIVILQQSVAN